jgi:LmbE family N-acetylglucosaminyl deacetylase
VLSKSPAKKVALLLLALVILVGAGQFGLPLWQTRRANLRQLKLPLPRAVVPDKTDRLLIISPHSDDETLGCGGLIAQALRAGAEVKVVLVTNGDGFHYGASRWFEEIKVPPKDFRRFAADRRQESISALATLGLPKAQVISLGYPDGGTAQMWLDFWSPDSPFTSPYTKEKRNPYLDTFHPGAPYCGQTLTEDLKRIFQQYQPTMLFCPHPNDNHPDHWALYAYTLGALYESDLQGRADLWVYLVHRGDWPLPQGLHLKRALSPPAALVGLGTRWESLPLEEYGSKRKLAALRQYHSPIRVMRRFIYSFARANELFGAPPRPLLLRVKPAAGRTQGEAINWSDLPPVLVEPGPDQAMTDLYPASDFTKIYAAQTGRRLVVRLDLLKPASRKLTYTLYLHPLIQGKVAPPREYRLQLGKTVTGGEFHAAGRGLEISLPWDKSWQGVILGAISQKGKRVLDKTAWVLLRPELTTEVISAPQEGNK